MGIRLVGETRPLCTINFSYVSKIYEENRKKGERRKTSVFLVRLFYEIFFKQFYMFLRLLFV